MLKVDVYSQNGEKKGKTILPTSIFEAKIRPSLMAQAVKVYFANQRRGTASTKTRSEVSGGGKKPWRQKGTGRARHGSIRSPIWVGGGKAHGPKPKDWALDFPKKMKRAALFSSLSQKAKGKKVIVVDKIDLKEIKTKKMAEILEKLPLSKKILLVLPEKNKKLYFSARNLPKVKIMIAKDLNTYQVLNAKSLLFLKDSLKSLEEVFGKKEGKVKKDRKKVESEEKEAKITKKTKDRKQKEKTKRSKTKKENTKKSENNN